MLVDGWLRLCRSSGSVWQFASASLSFVGKNCYFLLLVAIETLINRQYIALTSGGIWGRFALLYVDIDPGKRYLSFSDAAKTPLR